MAKRTEIYVHIWLEGETKPVPCGLLMATEDGRASRASFAYGREYIRKPNAIPLDPIELPLTEQQFETKPDFDMFSALRDSAPDGWGRHVLSRLKSQAELTEVEYLCLADPFDRFGSLGMGSSPQKIGGFENEIEESKMPSGPLKIGREIEFDKFTEAVQSFIEADGFSKHPEFRRYFVRGSSIGGARPKATVALNNDLWLAKFSRHDDLSPIPKIEYITMKVAKLIGLDVPELRLIKLPNHSIYLIKRFDRIKKGQHYLRTHAISGLTAIGAHERDYSRWGYTDLHNFIRQHGYDFEKDSFELYRRIIFNIVFSNTDDHLRNHAFLCHGGSYHLSPLYDVCPNIQDSSSVKSLFLKINDDSREALLSNALAYGQKTLGLSEIEAKKSIEEVLDLIKKHLNDVIEEAELSALASRGLESQLVFDF